MLEQPHLILVAPQSWSMLPIQLCFYWLGGMSENFSSGVGILLAFNSIAKYGKGDWVVALYEGEQFLGKVVEKSRSLPTSDAWKSLT